MTFSKMLDTLLHCNGSLVDREALKRYLRIYQSSSPSYVLMASIDHAVQAAMNGEAAFGRFYKNWIDMQQQLRKLKKIRVLPGPDEVTNVRDIGKLILSVKYTNVSGKELMDILREKYHLELEMACETYVLAMFTVADTRDGYERMIQALLEVDSELEVVRRDEERDAITDLMRESTAKQHMPFYQA